MSDSVPSTTATTKPKRQKWFTSYPYNTLGILSLTCSAMGIGSLFLELVMLFLVGQTPGQLAGLPVPFVSMPLGAGAIVITLIIASVHRRLALVPALAGALYWLIAGLMWPQI